MSVCLAPVSEIGLRHIVRNLRARDREEIFCTRWDDGFDGLVADCMAVSKLPTSYTVLAYVNNKPVAVLGACEPWPGLWDGWCFGTDDFDKVALFLTKHIHRKMLPLLLARGLRRMHCRSLASQTATHDWLRSIGASQDDERVLKGWGKNGEDFVMFEWHREALLKTYQPAEVA